MYILQKTSGNCFKNFINLNPQTQKTNKMDKNSAALYKKMQTEVESYKNLQKCK